MPPKRNRNRSHTPAWLDTLIAWLLFSFEKGMNMRRNCPAKIWQGNFFSAIRCSDPQHGLQALFHIGCGGCPGGDTDAHGSASLPDGTTAPAGAILLDRLDHPASFLRLAKRDQDL